MPLQQLGRKKQQKGRFLGMFFGILFPNLLGSMLPGKWVIIGCKGVIRVGEGQNF